MIYVRAVPTISLPHSILSYPTHTLPYNSPCYSLLSYQTLYTAKVPTTLLWGSLLPNAALYWPNRPSTTLLVLSTFPSLYSTLLTTLPTTYNRSISSLSSSPSLLLFFQLFSSSLLSFCSSDSSLTLVTSFGIASWRALWLFSCCFSFASPALGYRFVPAPLSSSPSISAVPLQMLLLLSLFVVSFCAVLWTLHFFLTLEFLPPSLCLPYVLSAKLHTNSLCLCVSILVPVVMYCQYISQVNVESLRKWILQRTYANLCQQTTGEQ